MHGPLRKFFENGQKRLKRTLISFEFFLEHSFYQSIFFHHIHACNILYVVERCKSHKSTIGIRICSIFTDRGKIDRKFLFAVNSEKLVARTLIIGGNRAASRINTLAG